MRNHASYSKRGYSEVGLFVYRGTTALKKGRGMCYDLDYLTLETGETAADAFGARGLVEVQVPSTLNNLAFAGVLTQDYPATPSGKIQLVELALPGSCCLIATGIATTINSTMLTAMSVGGGLFADGGFGGRGSAIALQTKAAAAGGVIGSSLDGSTAWTSATNTITKSGLFANAVVGDEVVVVAAQGITDVAKLKAYTIITKTSNDAVVVNEDIGATDSGRLCCYVRSSSNPLVMAYLMDGQESGLVDWTVPVTGAAMAPAPQVGGTTRILGGITIANNTTNTLANGTIEGTRKAFQLMANLTTGGVVVTVTTGLKYAAGTALSALTRTHSGTGLTQLRWNGAAWQCTSLGGFTEA